MKRSGKELNKLRLQVFLSRNGVCSRRRAFDVVKEGRVALNGKICREPSTPVDPGRDRISVDKKEIRGRSYEYVVLNKPKGFTTTRSDRFAEKTVYDLLPTKYHSLSPVGRLDRDTEGLLMLTNDGDTAYRLTHPKFNIEKIYFVCVTGLLSNEKRTRIEKGINIDGKKTSSAKIKNVKLLKDQTELTIMIHEGRKRQIRIMFGKVGYKVVYLKRLSQGPLNLGALKIGKWRALNGHEIEAVKKI